MTVVPHWRGRLCRYHFADYVLLDRRGAMVSRPDAERVFADAFARTGASWDDAPFTTEPATAWPRGRLYVPRLTAPCPPRKDAAALDLTGVVVAGQRWTDVYTVAALVSTALGWGRDSFAILARSVAPDGLLDETLADQILHDWLRAPTTAPTRVWAYVLTGHPAPTSAPARLLARTGPDVHVVLLTPDTDAVVTLASLSSVDEDGVGGEAEGWRRLLPRHERLTHVPVAAPTDRRGAVVTQGDRAFVDAYFDTSVEAALTVLDTLTGPGRARRRVVPPAVAARDPFAALAARRQRSRATSVSSSSSRVSSSPVSRSASPG